MDSATYMLFIYGTFEGHDEVEYFCMEVMATSPSVESLRYVIENNNNIIVIFDSTMEPHILSTELLTFMINDTIKYYLLYPLDKIITAHLPEKLKDFIFKPKELDMNLKVEYIPRKPKDFDLDDVLEKINMGGLDSLTEDEKNFLDDFSK